MFFFRLCQRSGVEAEAERTCVKKELLDMLRSRGLQLAAGAVVFGASAFMGFHYSVSSAPPPVQEPFPTGNAHAAS